MIMGVILFTHNCVKVGSCKTLSSIESLPLGVASGDAILVEGVEVTEVERHEKAEKGQEEIACEVVEYAEEPPENPSVLQDAPWDLGNLYL